MLIFTTCSAQTSLLKWLSVSHKTGQDFRRAEEPDTTEPIRFLIQTGLGDMHLKVLWLRVMFFDEDFLSKCF